jgi:hypothetical protein
MIHPTQKMVRVPDDLMTRLTFNVRDEADAATVAFVAGVV